MGKSIRSKVKRANRSILRRDFSDPICQLRADKIAKKQAVQTAKEKPAAAPKHFKAAPTATKDEDEPRRKAGKSKKTAKQRGKNRGQHVTMDFPQKRFP